MKSIEGAKGELQSQLLQLEEQVVLIIAILMVALIMITILMVVLITIAIPMVLLIIIVIMIRWSGSKGLSADWRKREIGNQS